MADETSSNNGCQQIAHVVVQSMLYSLALCSFLLHLMTGVKNSIMKPFQTSLNQWDDFGNKHQTTVGALVATDVENVTVLSSMWKQGEAALEQALSQDV